MMRACSFAVLLLLALVSGLFSQNVEIRPVIMRKTVASFPAATPVIAVSSKLVLVPVHVTNRAGASVNGLGPEAFTVFDNRVAQAIVSFGVEDAPCSVGVVLDLSGSMKTRLTAAAGVLHSFFEAANPEDEAFLLTVSTRPGVLETFTSDFGNLENHVMRARAGGATALNDTILLGLERMRQARYPRRVLLVISDGVDNHSRYTSPELLHRVSESDIQIYTIAVDNWPVTKKPIEIVEDQHGQAFLRALSARTGGLNREIRSFNDAADAAEKISTAIRSQYLIGFTPPTEAQASEWRTLQVKVNQPRTQTASRPGYFLR